jgi:acetyl esterase/lipase
VTRSRHTGPYRSRPVRVVAWCGYTTCPDTTARQKNSSAGWPSMATRSLCRICILARRPVRILTTQPRPCAQPAGCPTNDWSAMSPGLPNTCAASMTPTERSVSSATARVDDRPSWPPARSPSMRRSTATARSSSKTRRRESRRRCSPSWDWRPISAVRCWACSARKTATRHPSRSVATLDAELNRLGKDHTFFSYDGAGHSFFSVDRPAYRVDAAVDGWRRINEFFDTHLKG